MSVNYPKKYYLLFGILAIASALAIILATSKIIEEEMNAYHLRLIQVNKLASSELKEALNSYAIFVSGLRSYIVMDGGIPSKEKTKQFVDLQLGDISIEGPFSISYIDTSHIFIFDITKYDTSELSLEGTSMEKIIGQNGLKRMDTLMLKNTFYASDPTNLLEGKVGLPLGFGILDAYNKSLGYVTTVTEFAPMIKRVYDNVDTDLFVFSFQSSNGNYFDRTRSYNDQKVYSNNLDPECFRNFDIAESEYVKTEVPYYNKSFILGTAYKKPYSANVLMYISMIVLYLLVIGFLLFFISQYYIYRRKNKLIAAQKYQLSELVATKNKFFSIIAHDLRGPLTSIINFLDILKDEEQQSSHTKEIIDSLEDSSRSSITLLDNLLKWSKVQTGKIKYEPQPLDILSITSDQIRVQKASLVAKGLDVRIENSFKEKMITGDKNMIATIIRNLLSNAIKFSHNNDIIVIELSKVDGHFQFCIEDNGIGMSEDFRAQVLDLSKIDSKKGTRNEQGSGLGLVVSDQFVKAHQGKLTIESEEGKGTIVCFSIP